jgi:RNA polymerase sigma factor (sigma-70 family)
MEFQVLVARAFPELKQLKARHNKAGFNQLMKKIFPGVKQYINNELRRALENGSIPSGKYNLSDFISELYIMAYDHIHEVKEDKHLLSWLIKKADELLADTIIEEEFDQTFYENIDSIDKVEWDEMEERFSTDGDGDLVMEEELDDISYPKNDYILKNVFVEHTEEDLINHLDKELTGKEINEHISMVLHRLPPQMSSIFDLAINLQLKLEEIAEIKKIPIEEVNRYFNEARRTIRNSFESRFLLKNI